MLIKDKGTISEINGLDERTYSFIASLLKPAGKKITHNTTTYLLDKIGSDMDTSIMR